MEVSLFDSTLNITDTNSTLLIGNDSNANDTVLTPTSFPCMHCKINCDADSNCILCDYCTNWYHVRCAGVSNKKFLEFNNSPQLKYMCKFCKRKKSCDNCKKSISDNDPSHSIYCFSCGLLYCHECEKLSYSEIQRLNAIEQVYICHECSLDYYCLVCKHLCNHGCIQCNSCKSWIHFKCTKMTKKQISRFSRIENSVYFCTPCVSANLPFSKIQTPKLISLNEFQVGNFRIF